MNNQEWFKQESIESLRRQEVFERYPGYPEKRLFLFENTIDIPEGDWEMNPGEVPEPSEIERFRELGLLIDSRGRPLHPWVNEMAQSPEIGIVTGKGFFWKWGPNETVDPIAVRNDLEVPHVLLITRGDTGHLALPGGFRDNNEDPEVGAAREAMEEAFVDLSNLEAKPVYVGPVTDSRITAHAWAHTNAFRFDVPNKLAKDLQVGPYQGGDDATRAEWIAIDKINERLFGSHSLLVSLALNLRK